MKQQIVRHWISGNKGQWSWQMGNQWGEPKFSPTYCPKQVSKPWCREREPGRSRRLPSLKRQTWESRENKVAIVYKIEHRRGDSFTEENSRDLQRVPLVEQWLAQACGVTPGDWGESPERIRAWFLNPSATDIFVFIILCRGGRPVYCRMFRNIPGLYPVHPVTLIIPPVPSCDNQKCLYTLPNVPGKAKFL